MATLGTRQPHVPRRVPLLRRGGRVRVPPGLPAIQHHPPTDLERPRRPAAVLNLILVLPHPPRYVPLLLKDLQVGSITCITRAK